MTSPKHSLNRRRGSSLKRRQTSRARPKDSPEPARITQQEAQYGEDSANPLLWDLLNAQSQLSYCRDLPSNVPLPLLNQLLRRARVSHPHKWFAFGFLEKAAAALKEGNADFFTEAARTIEERKQL